MMKKIISLLGFILFLGVSVYAQDEVYITETDSTKDITVKVKNRANAPDVYIDGIKVNYEILDLIDQSKIETIDVVKGAKALKEYDALNGVVLITTKKSSRSKIKGDMTADTIIRVTKKGSKMPVIIIDDEIKTIDHLKKLKSKNIESINVFKDKEHKKKYNSENGVVVVKTKKKK